MLCSVVEFTDTSPGGFPLPSLSPKYKTEWKFSEKIKQAPPTTTPPKDDSQVIFLFLNICIQTLSSVSLVANFIIASI